MRNHGKGVYHNKHVYVHQKGRINTGFVPYGFAPYMSKASSVISKGRR